MGRSIDAPKHYYAVLNRQLKAFDGHLYFVRKCPICIGHLMTYKTGHPEITIEGCPANRGIS